MLGYGPSPARAASAVRADAIGLSGMTKPAMATMTAATTSRRLAGCVTRVMFIEGPFLVCTAPVGALGCATTRRSPAPTDLRVDRSMARARRGSARQLPVDRADP